MSPLEEGPSPGAVVLPSGESALDSGESVVPEGTEGSSVATASPIGSENSMGGGLYVLGPSGLASAAAGIIPQASAAARPRRRSEPLRFVGMASPSLVNGKPTPNISLFPRFRNRHPAARHVNRGWARVCATGWAVTARGNHPR